MVAEEFPQPIQRFLNTGRSMDNDATTKCCPSSSCSLPESISRYLLQKGAPAFQGYSDADKYSAKLVLSGLLPACLAFIENHRQGCIGVPMASGLFITACETDIIWIHIHSAREQGQTLIGLAVLKVFLWSLWRLAESGEEHKDASITVGLTRLVARCMRVSDEESFNRGLLEVGADERKWQAAVILARQEYNDSSGSTWFVSPDALPRVLKCPTPKDQTLCQWMLRPEVFNAIEGWIASGAWKRSPEVARDAPSWKRLRELFLVGCKCEEMSPEVWEKETLNKAAKLRTRSYEERDGSKGYICSAEKCEMPGTMKCSACSKARYCSKECQRTHWKQTHREECKRLKK